MSKMRIAVVGMFHETNTFAPGRTELDDFASEWVSGNEAFISRYAHTRTSMGGVVATVQSLGEELAVGLYAAATPSGIVTCETAAILLEEVAASLDTAADGVLVILHGAMVAVDFPDMEGELLSRLRSKWGASKPIAVTLDLHANISKQMADMSDIVVGYDTYPHIDAYERAQEALHLLAGAIRKEINPVLALAKPGLLIVPQVMLTDEEGPMKVIMKRAFAIEREPMVLNVTAAGGFPYSDVPDAGISFVVTTDGAPELARHYAEELAHLAWMLRDKFDYKGFSPSEAVVKAMNQSEGPVILVEGSDNVGGGARPMQPIRCDI